MKSILSGAVCLSFLLSAPAAGVAGGRPVECYECYRTAPVYDTVFENVMVAPPGRRVETVPAIYGTRKRAVLIAPQRVAYEVVPAVVETRHRTVKVAEAGYSWEWRWINGRNVLCKIRHKARYKKVAERVVVQPEYKRRIVVPAEYGYEQEKVLIQPERQRIIETPASYRTVARQILVSEGTAGWRQVNIRRHCG